jgi:hypothetical protein
MKARLRKFSGPSVGGRKGQQAAPIVDAEDVVQVVSRDFQPESQQQVFEILREFGSDHDGVTARVHLAALKLADGDIDRLITRIAAAIRDWRDIVSEAEYPAYLRERAPSELSIEQRQRVIESDWNQYHKWLGK